MPSRLSPRSYKSDGVVGSLYFPPSSVIAVGGGEGRDAEEDGLGGPSSESTGSSTGELVESIPPREESFVVGADGGSPFGEGASGRG